MTEEKIYYIARIKVERVTKNMEVVKEYDHASRNNKVQVTEKNRDVALVADLTFNANSTGALSKKISKHIELLTDGEME
jgi:hypothetical protein